MLSNFSFDSPEYRTITIDLSDLIFDNMLRIHNMCAGRGFELYSNTRGDKKWLIRLREFTNVFYGYGQMLMIQDIDPSVLLRYCIVAWFYKLMKFTQLDNEYLYVIKC